jgi:GTP cyclohydrolase IA
MKNSSNNNLSEYREAHSPLITPNGHVADTTPRIDYDAVENLGRDLLTAIGEDPNREGLLETPRRWASWWKEFIEYEENRTDTVFESLTSDQMVIVSGMRVYSLCEHHLLPFWADVSIGYIPRGQVLGLSKFARIAHKAAHKLQLQERMIQEIADEVARVTGTPDVMVVASGVHMCMVMRGIRTDATMTSMITRGGFAENSDTRADFLRLVNSGQRL